MGLTWNYITWVLRMDKEEMRYMTARLLGPQGPALAPPNLGRQQQNVRFLTVPKTRLVSEMPFNPAAELLSLRGRKIHGECVLPEGCDLLLLPPGTQFRDVDGNEVFQPDGRRWWAKLWTWIQEGLRDMKGELSYRDSFISQGASRMKSLC